MAVMVVENRLAGGHISLLVVVGGNTPAKIGCSEVSDAYADPAAARSIGCCDSFNRLFSLSPFFLAGSSGLFAVHPIL